MLQGQLEPKAAAAQQKRLQELRDSLVDNKTSEKTRRYAIKYHKVCHHPAFPSGHRYIGCFMRAAAIQEKQRVKTGKRRSYR